MASPTLDLVGTAGDPATQGLGRLIGQYVNSPKLVALLAGIYAMGQDLDNLIQRVQRLLNIDDNVNYSPDGNVTYPVNSHGAAGDQLRIIGQLEGVSSTLPNGTVLNDTDFRQLVHAKIYRNSAKPNIPSLRQALWWIFDPTNAALLQAGETTAFVTQMLTESLGTMCVRVTLIVQDLADLPSAPRLNLLRLPAGRNHLPYGLLPRMAGSSIIFQWQPNSIYVVPSLPVFSFSDASDPNHLPLSPGGMGFSNQTIRPQGCWATAFT